ncbi:RloB family protein [Candidatus Parcubacteria bacterium]|nr:RloB family protein [Patescibacteria group bacterium]MBU4309792.1 RloB family protein [Patescibacteria group bacterium]MBU4431798.1 RloB family protein [Patescibacteria group bacterium]MBU4578131.1 RloB family protein [Patescibacteria group bacterium]MCG2696668.1 RloB family protein [Candidatus Parcubacteria bacterium]
MSKFPRKINIRKPHTVIKIFTEGINTEPKYFNSIRDELRMSEIDIVVWGLGDHTLPLVESVLKMKQEEGSDEDVATEWWVVFDRDDHEHFDKSIKLAIDNGINVAYSNECFELWFILHFEFLNTAIGRRQYEKKLSELLGKKYNKKSSFDVYELVKDKEQVAIKNAKRLEKDFNDQGVSSYIKRDPSTLVYKLVERLRSLKDEKNKLW